MAQIEVYKRLQVPVTKETYRAFEALAEARGSSLATVSSEIFEEVAPMVWEMARAIELAKTAPSRALKEFTDVAVQELAGAEQVIMDLRPAARTKPKRKKSA